MANLNEHEALLLEKALGGDLTDAERKEFQRLCNDRPDVEQEWNAMQSLQEVTMTMRFKKAPEEQWDSYWANVYARLERGIAWLLITIGTVVVLALVGYQAVLKFLSDTETPVALKIGIGAVILGLAVLLVSVVREKWTMRQADKYREVIR